MPSGACIYCGRPCDANDYQRVIGWVGGAGKDGFKRSGYEDEWAHKFCIELNEKVGLGQQAMEL
jgi:hypothetical protein